MNSPVQQLSTCSEKEPQQKLPAEMTLFILVKKASERETHNFPRSLWQRAAPQVAPPTLTSAALLSCVPSVLKI